QSSLLDGVLCATGGLPRIFHAPTERWDDLSRDHQNCLQAGPLLVVDGKVAWPRKDENDPARMQLMKTKQAQAFVCIDERSHFVLGFTTAAMPGTVSDYIARSRASGGLGCKQALRIAGNYTGGVINGGQTVGEVDVLLPEAIGLMDSPIPLPI